jgi:hypothetical protein
MWVRTALISADWIFFPVVLVRRVEEEAGALARAAAVGGRRREMAEKEGMGAPRSWVRRS